MQKTKSYEIKIKAELIRAALLTYPRREATIELMTTASNKAIRTVLQHRIEIDWKFSATDKEYSTYDSELMAIYVLSLQVTTTYYMRLIEVGHTFYLS